MTPAEREAALELVVEQQKERSGQRLQELGMAGDRVPYILLPYQVRWHQDDSIVRLCEKGRRIGFTWGAWAAEASLDAALADGGMDQFYMGYNQGMAAEFIGDCAHFARWYGHACSDIDVGFQEVIIDDEKKDIVTYKIKFASGHKIEALSAMPHNWRGRQGHARIDEAGHHQKLEEVINGALAYRIWGGRVSIGGTHKTEDNPFNDLVKRVRTGKLPWSLHRVTFSDAIREGLYKRICLVTKKQWSPEAEKEFVASARADYTSTEHADEELECIPRRGSGAYFSRLLLEKCVAMDARVVSYSKPAIFVTDPERLEITRQWIEDMLAPMVRAIPTIFRTVLGQDFGRSGDLSVIVIGQKFPLGLGWWTPLRLELRNIPFDCQKLIVTWLLQNLPLFHHAKFDARGNGQSHAEAALQLLGPQRVECVMATPKWYDDNFPKYHQAYEDGEISTFGDEDWIADHRNVVLINGSPRVSDARTKGSDGYDRHGDAAIAGVLMWAAARMEVAPAAGTSVDAQPGAYRSDRGGRAAGGGLFGGRSAVAQERPQRPPRPR